MNKETLTLGSLFSGSGGFELAGMLAGIQPVWNSEIEPFAIRVTTRRLPGVRHYGDVSELFGAELPPVDIITFGSPCQDLSVAGRRAGLGGERSGLFHQAVRIIREMREKTNGERPRYCVWENVPGAFSSNGGEDFRAVLSAFAGIKEPAAEVPAPGKKGWPCADVYMGDGWSVAYRLLDAQFWGVPQRRARIFLVADLGGDSAGDILFKSEGLSGYSAAGFEAWKRAARSPEGRSGEAGRICMNGQGGDRMNISEGAAGTLCVQDHGHPPAVMAAGFCTEHSARSRSIGYGDETSPTLRAGVVPAAVALENHPADGRIRIESGNAVQTLTGRMGTGGNNVPLILRGPAVSYNCRNDHAEEEICGTIQAKSTGGYSLNYINPVFSASKASYFTAAAEDVANTLVATDYKDPPIVNDHTYGFYPQMKAEGTAVTEEVSCTLVNGTNPGYQNGVIRPEYFVRRLTPTECARLQGFPDWWCRELGTEEPSEEEISFWTDVFETHRRLVTHANKPKTRNQIVKWLKAPHLDSAEYRLWGNGVALPCVWFVMAGIVWAHEMHNIRE